MTTATVTYQGNLRTQAIHLQSNTTIITDAPTDNHGKGEAFSPTDLVASSLASCMLTIMGIKAADLGVDLTGTTAQVTKTMQANPRAISQLDIGMTFANKFDDRTQTILKHAALTCPVAKSLHPDIVQNVTFNWL